MWRTSSYSNAYVWSSLSGLIQVWLRLDLNAAASYIFWTPSQLSLGRGTALDCHRQDCSGVFDAPEPDEWGSDAQMVGQWIASIPFSLIRASTSTIITPCKSSHLVSSALGFSILLHNLVLYTCIPRLWKLFTFVSVKIYNYLITKLIVSSIVVELRQERALGHALELTFHLSRLLVR